VPPTLRAQSDCDVGVAPEVGGIRRGLLCVCYDHAGDPMRAFFCIPLQPVVATSIDRIARDIRDATRMRARWVRRENYHITLRFLGEIDPLMTVELERIARRVTGRLEPFTVILDGLGCFPSVDRARVLWIGGEPPPAFYGLVSSLHHELRKLGFPMERRETGAHVTLARLRGRADPKLGRVLDDVPRPSKLGALADRIVLMESILGPAGPTYTALCTTRFRGRESDGH